MNSRDIQYVSDENGKTLAVIVPIEMWHDNVQNLVAFTLNRIGIDI